MIAFLRGFGALSFVLGVTLLALDTARSLKIHSFEATTLERFWINLGADGYFNIRFHFSNWLGSAADKVLDLPAAFVAFGLGMALLLAADGAMREYRRKPMTF